MARTLEYWSKARLATDFATSVIRETASRCHPSSVEIGRGTCPCLVIQMQTSDNSVAYQLGQRFSSSQGCRGSHSKMGRGNIKVVGATGSDSRCPDIRRWLVFPLGPGFSTRMARGEAEIATKRGDLVLVPVDPLGVESAVDEVVTVDVGGSLEQGISELSKGA